jgi:hypothetical protein
MSASSADKTRRGVLLGLVGVVALAVIVDRTGLLGSSDASAGSAEVFRDAQAVLAQQRALVADAERIAEARDAARSAWREASRGVIVETTRPLAESTLRAAVLAAARSSGADVFSIRASPAEPAASSVNRELEDSGSSVRAIALSVGFDARVPGDAYEVIDTLERLPDIRTRVTTIDVSGPGIMLEAGRAISVSLTVEALALIENASEEAAPTGSTGGER